MGNSKVLSNYKNAHKMRTDVALSAYLEASHSFSWRVCNLFSATFFKPIPNIDHGATIPCRIERKIQVITTRPP
jgi:hypothetical protein